LITAETWRACQGPSLACLWQSRTPENPYATIPSAGGRWFPGVAQMRRNRRVTVSLLGQRK